MPQLLITPPDIVQGTTELTKLLPTLPAFVIYAVDPEMAMPAGAAKVPDDPVNVEHAEMLKPETVQATTELALEFTTNTVLPEIARSYGTEKVPPTDPVKGVAQLLITSPETVQAVIEFPP